MAEPDLILDVLERVKTRVPLPAEVVTEVEAEARRYWGGERCYVAKAGETPVRREARERADAIRSDFRRGERVKLLARRYDMSERHIRRILGIAEAVATEGAANDAPRPLPQHGGIAARNRRHRARQSPATGLDADIVLP